MRKSMRKNATLAIILSTSLLAACSNNSSSPETTPTGGASSKPAAAPIKIEIMQDETVSSADGPGFPKDDFIKNELNKKLNIDLTMTLDTSDYLAKLNTRMAGGNFPDVMLLMKEQVQQYAQNGVLLDMGPYLDKLTDYKKFVGADDVKKGVVSGKQYALPKAPGFATNTYWIRKDWLDKLNLAVPTTVDELFNVAKAFTENDPDGNGKKDTLGITGVGIDTFAPVFGAYGVTPSAATLTVLNKDKIVNSLYDPAMKDALTTVKKFIDAGVVDPEFMSNKPNTSKDKAFQGKIGIIFDGWSGIIKDTTVKIWKQANPNADWIQLTAPKGPNGLQYASKVDIASTGKMLAFPKALEKQPEKINKIIELLNYVSTTEGNRLVDYGLKDVHYKVDGDKITITEQGQKESGYSFVYQFTGRPELAYLQTKFPAQAKYIEFEKSLPRLQVIDKFVDMPNGYNKADAERFIQEKLTEFIYGKTPIADYDKFLTTLEGSFNYKVYTDAVTKQAKDLGLTK
ncbi:extracellular solute-binding protein [Paenibacillus sp. HWE-109]|uniref:extracellular solute-binding protein n=1 Tax=Paenibacillus sp. HWE-109 TaxID=1306526 RepID=UPI001EDEA450|nr:extracellular solute-binding protein [Paenibacillus sp. HWE-109]UKS24130.1 extracellular solute-binding protein [Paenibacillus sp. HWE-109]